MTKERQAAVTRVLLIIPAYNESESIVAVLTELAAYRDSAQLDFALDYLVVNDGSHDATADLVRAQGVTLISLATNLGLAAAVMTGMTYAVARDYDAVIQFDADGQHQPDYIAALVASARQGHAIVIGSRFVSQRRPLSARMLGNVLISLAIKLTTGQTIKDPTSGMRLYDRRAMRAYIASADMTPEPETISYFIKKKFPVAEVAIEIRQRTGGKSYLNIRRSISYMTRTALSILILQPFRK